MQVWPLCSPLITVIFTGLTITKGSVVLHPEQTRSTEYERAPAPKVYHLDLCERCKVCTDSQLHKMDKRNRGNSWF